MKTKLLLFVLLPVVSVPAVEAHSPDGMEFSGSTGSFTWGLTLPDLPPGCGPLRERIEDDFSTAAGCLADQQAMCGWTPAEHPWEFLSDVSVWTSGSVLVCALVTEYQYTGGAHGNTGFRSYIFDRKSGLFGSLEEYIGGEEALGLIASAAADSLRELLRGDSDLCWIDAGAAPSWANYASALPAPPGMPPGLVVFFPPYQVAPYAYGPQEVFIPEGVYRR